MNTAPPVTANTHPPTPRTQNVRMAVKDAAIMPETAVPGLLDWHPRTLPGESPSCHVAGSWEAVGQPGRSCSSSTGLGRRVTCMRGADGGGHLAPQRPVLWLRVTGNGYPVSFKDIYGNTPASLPGSHTFHCQVSLDAKPQPLCISF